MATIGSLAISSLHYVQLYIQLQKIVCTVSMGTRVPIRN